MIRFTDETKATLLNNEMVKTAIDTLYTIHEDEFENIFNGIGVDVKQLDDDDFTEYHNELAGLLAENTGEHWFWDEYGIGVTD